jgi:hypothetical protein
MQHGNNKVNGIPLNKSVRFQKMIFDVKLSNIEVILPKNRTTG